jgi:hypothetical protein
VSAWQPIETAPKGEAVVLISSPAWPPEGRVERRPAVICSYFSDGDWRYMDHRRVSGRPTHWMPLPDAPDAARSTEPRP